MTNKKKCKLLILITIYVILEVTGFFSAYLTDHRNRFIMIWVLKVVIFIYLMYSSYLLLKDSFIPPLPNISEEKRKAIEQDKKRLFEEQAKYLALQTQINPHFLYNTLEGIRSEALLGGVPSAAKMSELLAKFFRYNISNLEKMVTIEDELKNLKNYFKIQYFRFESRLKIDFIFEGNEEQIKKCKTPKLILQPIIENAIHHGIEPLLGQGMITVRLILYTDRLLIVISDNGVGMNPDQVSYLNEKTRNLNFEEIALRGNSTEIGIINVNKRIQLLFGLEYGLYFYSEKGVGTDVEITIPISSVGK